MFLALVTVWWHNGFGSDDGDWQFWPRVSVEGRLFGRWKIYFEEELRNRDDMSERYFYRTILGIGTAITPWLFVQANYKHSYVKSGGLWIEEQRPHVDVTASWKLGSFSFKDRNRFEFRMFREKENSQTYRNALTITPPVNITSFQIQPYLTEEIFIHLNQKEIVRYRIYVGLRGKIQKQIGMEIYAMLQRDDRDVLWQDTNVMGTKLKILL